MKQKNKILAIILVVIISLTSGCGSDNYLKDENGNILTNEVTGQSVQKDILCRPSESSELYNIYKEKENQMEVKLEELPTCEDFKINSNKYDGLWEAILVRPLAYIILRFGYLFNNMGISVMVVGLLIRLILLPFAIKSMRQTNNMQKAQPEIAKIEKKYEGKTDSEAMMAKSQEMMLVYQKYKINPVSGCLVALIQIPLFFAFLDAINEVPAIFEGNLFGMHLGMTPWKGLAAGEYIYIALIFLIVATTYISFKNSMNDFSPSSNSKTSSSSVRLSLIVIFKPFVKKADSRMRSAIVSKLKAIVCLKISGSGLKVTSVPVSFVLPVSLSGVSTLPPSLNDIS